ncbi:MAG TPA: YHS domain-containing protein [Kofleriaceae bacterium]|jgi:YHS domain-containing protein
MRIKSTLLLCSLSIAFWAAACAGSAPPPAAPKADTATATVPAPLVAAGEAKVGDRTKCIVSGHEFVVKADSPHAEYNGKTYYFCCPDCPKAFAAHPEKYVPSA